MLSQRQDPGRTRACNHLWFRIPTLYALGHKASCFLVARNAGGRPKFSADKPAGLVGSRAVFGGWRATDDWLRFADGMRPREDLICDRWIQSPAC